MIDKEELLRRTAVKKSFAIVMFLILCILAISCDSSFSSKEETVNVEDEISDEYIVVGFSQLVAESDWRSANTESMKAAFTTADGYKLIFEDGQQKQTNQITAIRTFIQQEVDYIVLAPVT